MISIFHPDYMLHRLDASLKRRKEEWAAFTPEERLADFKSRGWVDENGVTTPEFESLRRLMHQFD